ncbi:hypothetical protein U1Q18_028887 [Sarracenia purpurea var. burkii]
MKELRKNKATQGSGSSGHPPPKRPKISNQRQREKDVPGQKERANLPPKGIGVSSSMSESYVPTQEDPCPSTFIKGDSGLKMIRHAILKTDLEAVMSL